MEESLYTTTSGAARILQVSEGTIRQMVHRGELPAIRTDSGVRLFDRQVVDRVARERLERRSSQG